MITPSDLRIGNLISHNSVDCTVFSLSKAWLRVTKDRNIAISYDNISGIPLTEQWLIDLGFEKQYLSPFNFDLGKIKVWCGLNGSILFIYNEPEFVRVVDFKFVHQLMNLYYFLTGEELNIKP